jgi:hypothetical protein
MPSILTAFHPSFESSQIKLRSMLPVPSTTQHPQLITPTTSVLPEVPRRITQPAVPAPAAILRAVPSTELAKRALKMEIPGIQLTEPHAVQFRISISAEGHLLTALPLSSVEEPELMRRLQAALRSLHFLPDPKTPRQWGTLSFRWERPQ